VGCVEAQQACWSGCAWIDAAALAGLDDDACSGETVDSFGMSLVFARCEPRFATSVYSPQVFMPSTAQRSAACMHKTHPTAENPGLGRRGSRLRPII